MMFMNEYDILRAHQMHGSDPILRDVVNTLSSVADWANGHSDGWAHWPAPARAASKLMQLIYRADAAHRAGRAHEITATDVRRALTPVKSFRTRHGADFVIYGA